MNPAGSRVLLVASDGDGAARICEMLRDADTYDTRHVERLGEAGAAIEAFQPHAVLLDLGDDDGHDVPRTLERMRELAGDTPVIVLSNTEDEPAAADALQPFAQDCLSKRDLSASTLHRALRHALERRLLIEELRAARQSLEELVRVDPLTELLNRRGFEEIFERERQRACRDSRPLHLLAWDLDDFKEINNSLGHAAGDALLREVSRRATASLRETDVLARVDGDGFLALLPATRAAEAFLIAERLRLSLASESFEVSGQPVRLTASIGLTALDPERDTFENAFRSVDHELRRGRRTGESRVSFRGAPAPFPHDAGLPDECLRSLMLEIRRVENEALVAREWLTRTTLPGLERPDAFFSACREASRLTEADLSCLRRSAAAAFQRPSMASDHINVFPSTLLDVGAEGVLRILENAGLEKPYLCISETEIVGDPSLLVPALDTLREAGCSLSVDRVGCGGSCIESLVVLNPAVVKVERGWTQGIADDPGRQRELRRLIRILAGLVRAIVVARPEDEGDQRIVREMAALAETEILWSEPPQPHALELPPRLIENTARVVLVPS